MGHYVSPPHRQRHSLLLLCCVTVIFFAFLRWSLGTRPLARWGRNAGSRWQAAGIGEPRPVLHWSSLFGVRFSAFVMHAILNTHIRTNEHEADNVRPERQPAAWTAFRAGCHSPRPSISQDESGAPSKEWISSFDHPRGRKSIHRRGCAGKAETCSFFIPKPKSLARAGFSPPCRRRSEISGSLE